LARLELRGITASVPVAAWQLASEGVRPRECAQTRGCKQMDLVLSNDRRVAARCGGGRQRWRTMRRGRHLADRGARSGTACPAVVWSRTHARVWPRGKVSSGTTENKGSATTQRRCPTPARYHACERVDMCACTGTCVCRQRNTAASKAQRHTTSEWKGKDSGSKQGSTRVEEGSGTCKATGSARWPALKRRRVCVVARSGRGPTGGTQGLTSTPGLFQPRLEGRVLSTVTRVVRLTLGFWTRRRNGGDCWGTR
jgi:hypothetical protein